MADQGAFRQLLDALTGRGAAIAEGLWGTSARALTAAVLQRHAPPVCLYCLAHVGDAEDALEELAFYTGVPAQLFPAWDSLPREANVADEILAGRLRVLKELKALRAALGPSYDGPTRIIVAPVQALLQPVPSPRHLDDNTVVVRKGESQDPAALRAWLVGRGFSAADLVGNRGAVSYTHLRAHET